MYSALRYDWWRNTSPESFFNHLQNGFPSITKEKPSPWAKVAFQAFWGLCFGDSLL